MYNIIKKNVGMGGAKPRAYCGMNGGAWCNAYVCYAFNQAGQKKLFYGGKKVTYCPTSIQWCRANLAEIPLYLAMPCDIIYFDWQPNGTPDHIGFVKAHRTTTSIFTHEGNTSGGKVAEKTRTLSRHCRMWVFRPHFAPTGLKKEKLTVDGDFGYKSIYNLQIALGIKANGILDKSTVKALQKKAGASPDGAWGKKTSIKVQKMVGAKQDGAFGKSSVEALQKWINGRNYSVTPQNPVSTPKNTTQTNISTASTLGKCIDVSYWQAKISADNWKKILKTCEYVICRASYTSLSKFALDDDSTFAANVANAKAAGVKYIGAYHFSQALSVAEAQKEAKFLCDILDKYKGINFWVACDYETNAKGRLNGKTVSTKASEIANAFCAVVEKRGYKACIYANYTMLTKYLKAPKYPIWLAQYNNTKSYNKNVVMWQYTSTGRVDGITAKNTNNKSANVDLSYVYALPMYPAKPTTPTTPATKPTTPTVEKKAYTGKFPSLNNNTKIVNGMAYRMCYPYGTPQKKYTYKDGKPTENYKKCIDKVFPKHGSWPNKKQKVGACCDVFVAVCLGYVNIIVKKDLKNQLVDMPKMTTKLKSNGHYLAKDFKMGDVVQRGRKDKSGHTWIVCELVNGKKYVANAHYKKLNGTYAVMDAVPKNIVKSKWAYYKCYTVLGAIRTYYKQGDYGYDVLYIQKFLTWYGIKCSADGDYGEKTKAAVKDYQKKRGLTVDGIVGEKTIADMKKAMK